MMLGLATVTKHRILTARHIQDGMHINFTSKNELLMTSRPAVRIWNVMNVTLASGETRRHRSHDAPDSNTVGDEKEGAKRHKCAGKRHPSKNCNKAKKALAM